MVGHGHHAELVCGAGCGPGVLGARPGRDHRQAGPIPLRHEHRGVRGPAPGLLYCTVLYCTVPQVQPQGEYNLAGVNLGGMRDTMALQNVFFRNPSFGVRRSNNQMFREVLTTIAAKIFVTHYLKIFSQSWAATTVSGQSTSATGSSSSAAGRRAPASPPTQTTTSSTAWTPTWSASSKTDGPSVPGK